MESNLTIIPIRNDFKSIAEDTTQENTDAGTGEEKKPS
jgi:hypothetical protein